MAKKVVWITGASSGIGEALTMEYAKSDACIIISARRTSELTRVKNNCDLEDEKIKIVAMDLACPEKMKDIVKEAIDAFGHIDILINNAGISQRSLIKDTKFEVYQKLININYLGTVALSIELLHHFISRKNGHFVNVTSLMGKFASPYRAGYCGAKHALHGFFDAMRLEHEDDGIDVTLVCPGFVQTNVSLNAITSDGSNQNTMDVKTQNGMTPIICAKKIITAINAKKFEAYIGGMETTVIMIRKISNRLAHKLIKRSAVT